MRPLLRLVPSDACEGVPAGIVSSRRALHLHLLSEDLLAIPQAVNGLALAPAQGHAPGRFSAGL